MITPSSMRCLRWSLLSAIVAGAGITTASAQTPAAASGLETSTAAPLNDRLRAPAPPSFSPGLTEQTQPPATNPTIVEFTASADHAVSGNGVPLLTRYLLELVDAAGATVSTKDLGKPTPVVNTITFSQLAPVYAALPPQRYTVRIAAEGPGGVTRSPLSDPFDLIVRPPAAAGKPVIR
jgi:hypothetical protein